MQVKEEYSSHKISSLEEYISTSFSAVEITKLGDEDNFGFDGTSSAIGHVRLVQTKAVGTYEIRPLEPMDATVFIMILERQMRLNARSSDLRLAAGMATVFYHPEDVQLLEGLQQLSLIVPNSLLQRRLTHLLDGGRGRPLRFDTSVFSADAFGPFAPALQSLPGSPLLRLAQAIPGEANGLEEMMVDSLILNVPNNNSDFLSRTPMISPRQVKRALECIHATPDRHVSPVTLAKISGVSTRALQYAFKKATGQTITEYQLSLRMELARAELLNSADRSIDDIRKSLGFVSASHFSHAFKKIFGISPRKFRQIQM